MDQIITFNKSYQERLLEYTDVLGGFETLPASQIKQEWCFYFELTVDACGWQAVWKIPRLTCEQLQIEFPTVVLVYVENITYEDLSASVLILNVQDDIDLPKQHNVPIIQLWPTKEQDSSVCLNLASTSNSVDMLQFFYTNLFLPWDIEEDGSNWFSKHLVSRLRLFYDLHNGTIPSPTAELIKGLLTEARHLQVQQKYLISDIDEDVQINPDPTLQSTNVKNLLKVRLRIMQLRNELELLEDASLRHILLLNKINQLPNQSSNQPQYWAIFEEGKIDEFLSFFCQIKIAIGNKDIICQSNLSLALENINVNDTIFLNSAKHVFHSLGALQEGGVIKGLSLENNTILSSVNEDITIDCCGDIVLENLHIDVGLAQCGILVRCGIVTLKNCIITGDYKSSTHQGIIILAGGKLVMENCKVNGFYTAIIINSNGSCVINNSIIYNVNDGLKFYEKCEIKITNTKFQNCVRYGINMETDDIDLAQEGSFDVLKNINNVFTEDIHDEGIGKQQVKINYRPKLEAVKDLLSIPDLNPSYIQSTSNEDDDEGDEMEVSSSSSKLCLRYFL